jgi:thiol-disulfide isomerase/thioredoxin
LFPALCAPGTSFALTIDVDKLEKVKLPAVAMVGPDRAYLGLPKGASFTIPQISAKIIFIQVLSMYCPYCQAEAPRINELLEKVSRDKAIKDKVKFIGVGIGNTPFEANFFRRSFNVPFPVIPDEKMKLEKAAEKRFRTPTFILVKKTDGSNLELIDVHVGAISNIDDYFNQMKKAAEK